MWKWNLLCWLMQVLTPKPAKRRARLLQLQERLQREIDSVGDCWQTQLQRAKVPASPLSEQLPAHEQVAVLMQGPIQVEDDFTLKTLEHYRAIFPRSPMVLSTWEPVPARLAEQLRRWSIEVVESSLPAFPGPGNINCQLRSVQAGLRSLESTTAQFILKTRTDTRIYAANVGDFLAGLVQSFPVKRTAGERPLGPQGRLIALDLATRKYVPYHLSDIMMFGYRRDMVAYWSTPEFGPERQLARPTRFGDFVRDAIPEVLLCESYLRRNGMDPAPSLQAWWDLLASQFMVVDRSMIELFWRKYNYAGDHRMSGDDHRRNLALFSFRDWINLAQYQKHPILAMEDLADLRVNELVPAA